VSSTGANNDQTVINNALEAVKNAGGGKVYLEAGVYKVDNTVIVWSNTVLTGSPDAVLMVAPTSSQWYIGSVGIISCKESVKNVEIYGFTINGNLGAFPPEYANSHSPHKKDCMRCIILHGESGNYGDNIKIHHMQLLDSFSDGAYLYYLTNVSIYNNFISNTQHEGVFLSVVIGAELYGNQIAGVGSDNMRLDNSINCRIFDNILFSYDGDNLNGQYPHGESGVQIGNQGFSFGYGSPKPTVTANIELFNNTFANTGLKAIVLGAGSDNNVYVHSNKFINVAELETLGVSVKGISPTIQQSEKVFSSIFDILKMDYNFVYPDVSQDLKGNVQVLSYKNYSLVDVQGEDITVVKVSYDDKQVTHYIEKDIWVGSLSHQGNRVYLPGSFQRENLKVTCISSQGFQVVTNFEIIENQEQAGSINPDAVPFIGTLLIFGIALFRNLGRLIK